MTINHIIGIIFVMLVEIPEPEVILGVILAFLVGMGGLYGYFKIRPFIKTKAEINDSAQEQRLEYYERQLIDMKIRLDALEMEGLEQKTEKKDENLKEVLKELATKQVIEDTKPENEVEKKPQTKKIQETVPESDSSDITEQVLRLITTKPMTSRDIQNTLKKSREHSSRFLKKLFEDGYVDRDTKSKPYTYSITKKGKEKLGLIENSPTVA